MIRKLKLNDIDVEYDLIYKNIKNINLRIKFDGSIVVSAPNYVKVNRVDEFIIYKKNFILKSIEKFKSIEQIKISEKRYISGESFFYLGKNLQLKVISGLNDEIYSDGVFLYLKTFDKDNYLKKEKIVENWFKEQRQIIYNEIAREIYKKFVKYNIDYPIIKIRKMKRRWGSCHIKSKIITINSILINFSRDCIEYVIMHEFCHLIYPNHSKNFYLLLQIMMPDWKERKRKLEEVLYY